MPDKRKMPENFFWGNSVSSMQTEGAWDIDGKGKSVYDIREATPDSSDWKVAIDEYHRYEEDLDLMKEMNLNMYRIQISWSRCNPTGDGAFNEEGFAYYENLIDAMIARGITPMICLYHFDMPLNLSKKENGFVSRKVVSDFFRFAKEVIDRFAGKVKYWITFNEHNLYFQEEAFRISGYLKGEKTLSEMYQILHHTMLAHAKVDEYIHANYPDLLLGGMLAYEEVYPATSKPKDVLAARKIQEFMNNNLYDAFAFGHYSNEVMHFIATEKIDSDFQKNDMAIISKMHADFLAFSYYRSDVVNADKIPNNVSPNEYLKFGGEMNRFLDANEWNWTIDPLGFRDVITKIYNRYHLPVFPIENGIGLREHWDGIHQIEDDTRIKYHEKHIKALKDAMFIDGAKVLGYLAWGLIDIPSSHGDMEKRYGAVYVNRTNHDLKDLQRVPKKSFYWFKSILEKNGDEL